MSEDNWVDAIVESTNKSWPEQVSKEVDTKRREFETYLGLVQRRKNFSSRERTEGALRKERDIKKLATAVAEKVPELVLPIPEIVKIQGRTIDDEFFARQEHLARLSRITGDKHQFDFDIGVAKRLVAAGFVWFVDRNFVSRFQHAAAITPSKEGRNVGAVRERLGSTSWNNLKFKGDIPDFALTKMETAMNCGITHITAHSHAPFPMELEFVKDDPVAIGWATHPHIEKNNLGKFNCPKDQIGIVIAIWEGQEEIHLQGDIV